MGADDLTGRGEWITDPQIIASAEAMRVECGHPPREAHHWWLMWLDWGEVGDRWVRMARAARAAEPSEALTRQTAQLRALRAMREGQ